MKETRNFVQGPRRGSLRVSQSPNGPHDSRINLEKDIRTGKTSARNTETLDYLAAF